MHGNDIGKIQLLVAETFSSSVLGPLPETKQIFQRKVDQFISGRIKQDEKGDSSLLFKSFHKSHLMRMDIGQGKSIHCAFFGIKAYRDSLNRTDIVYRTLLLKIGKGNVPVFLVDADGGNGGWNFLNQSKALLQVLLVGAVDEFF